MDVASGNSIQADEPIYTLLVTANVGSLFEDPLRLLRPWLEAFFLKVGEVKPQFLALHLQELGGKTYEKSTQHVKEFVKQLCDAAIMQNFDVVRIFLDEDFNTAEHFTALGNIYFIHKHIENVRLWNFFTRSWETAEGKTIYSGNIETVSNKEKSKFPKHFFPECKWSRKGYMRTRWNINNTVFDLVNIHLFHDASNLAACEEFPSVYCRTRRRALVHTIERFQQDESNGLVPFFVFGDFNFRCDISGVIKELTQNLTAHRIQSTKNDNTKIYFRDSEETNILTIGKKEFNHIDHQLKFKESWLRKFDRELEPLRDFLYEFTIDFPPSYPYMEDPEMPTDFMFTRCPSWCDRILMNPEARRIIDDVLSPNKYNIIGENICMGDHKPVYLHICIKPKQAATINNSARLNQSDETPNSKLIKESNANIERACILSEDLIEDVKKCNVNKENPSSKHLTVTITNASSAGNMKSHSDEFINTKDLFTKTPVSINIFDTNNISVCECFQISSDENNDELPDTAAICTLCKNTIKKQSIDSRYRLVSESLVLSNNAILNRIDTQHLSTNIENCSQFPDPYTPESTESHSPCPEYNSCTSTFIDVCALDTSCRVLSSEQQATVCAMKYTKRNELEKNGSRQKTVSPQQLKTRLEDLQISSTCEQYSDGGNAGDVDGSCRSNTGTVDFPNTSLHRCCNIH
uniref:inositol-polyphosphate 5-phosphatase n=1 Tax=Musca domestica TaxID=7370 RepID=A0A1I8M351_MUSDO